MVVGFIMLLWTVMIGIVTFVNNRYVVQLAVLVVSPTEKKHKLLPILTKFGCCERTDFVTTKYFGNLFIINYKNSKDLIQLTSIFINNGTK